MVHVLLPIVAGCVAPGLKAVGLFVWADCWAHDAVALNGFKSSLATGLFAALVAAFHRRAVAAEVVGWLALSSVLGIAVSDTLWLESLRILGAKRMIAIDATKPFVGAARGCSSATPPARFATGVVATTAGVYLLNRAEPAEDDDEKRAALRDEEKDETRGGGGRRGSSLAAAPPAMTRRAWRNVVFGVVCVTFLTPLIYTWTMFVLPLSVAITLSLAPICSRSASTTASAPRAARPRRGARWAASRASRSR
ncbi:EamA-like transporter [Aureococcus anophagefferens]|nr:EamA-like transporter [Aureococcus anophagefferens]